MGCVPTITKDHFPTQGKGLGTRVEVVFHYETAHVFPGIIVRDDWEAPWELIIQLDDGRFIRGVECQYEMPN